ncbi:hypothetical protein K443DRAFT_521051 [Laccaria amethystina LaAM-08-1]|uniref:Uncharacterized protein n=1 Tax=Laccaria amethystina LaAM-08-1 TaxID=1095629 RepID=A0A0C9Y2U6_9AGAR|nr:hypothetical protein K443DRAFT_521051 [Laccaria amethystina LaAM-08-1]
MLLVQKPPTFNLAQTVSYSHRRHPSAPPAVVVQPTRTPGLLSLSKPPRPSPQRPLPSQQRPTKPTPKSKPAPVARAPLLSSAEITEKKTPASVASPSPRGRLQAKNPQSPRSASHSGVRGKPGRQPSPPISQNQLLSSQAEAAVISSSTNLFDPFLDDSSRSSAFRTPTSSPPTLARPSGKLARRRQQQPQFATPSPSPVLSKAIPVPKPKRTGPSTLSRSEPVPSHMPPRPTARRSSSAWKFPICDDMTEVGDFDQDHTIFPPPVTPARKQFQVPYTAPISGRFPGEFSFNGVNNSPSPVSLKRGGRKHRRAPSEGVFNMSSDEDVSTGPGGTILNPNVQALFGLARTPAPETSSPFVTPTLSRAVPSTHFRESSSSPSAFPLSREKQLEREAAEKAAAYFASSMFQNSPSPEELPDPLFV